MSKFVTLHGFGVNGVDLNFEVIAYESEEVLLASTPAENTIGVVTTTPMTSWSFSATEPANPENGMIWVTTGIGGDKNFNALKKNELQVYPINNVKQYVGAVWVVVTAMNFKNGAWNLWWNGKLYDNGDEFVSVTGGWKARSIGVINTNGVKPTVKKNANTIVITHNTYATGAALEIANDIDVSDYDILTVNIGIELGSGYVGVIVYDRSIGQTGSSYAAPFSNTIAYKSFDRNHSGNVSVNISGVNKEVCIGIVSYNSVTGTTNKVTMRKAILT